MKMHRQCLRKGRLKVEALERASHILRMLAHPQRLRIIEILERDQEVPVHALMSETGFPHAVVSQHLNQMRRMSLLAGRRQGREMHYSISDPRALSILNCICSNSKEGDYE